jgi:hypothetical protein
MKFYSGIVTGSLTVNGTQTINGTLTARTLVVQTITSSVSAITGSTKFGSSSANTHQFTGSMNVTGGINLNSGNILTVYRADNARGLQLYTTNNECVVDSWEATSEPLMIRSNGSSGRIVFHTSGSEKMRITSGGSIGIGTSPSAIVKTDILLDTTAVTGIQIRTSDAGTTDGSTTAKIFRTVNSGAGNWANAQYDGYDHIFTRAGTETFRITNAGNVKIQNNGGLQLNGGYLVLRSTAEVSYGYFLRTSGWKGGGSTDNTPALASEGGYGLNFYTNGAVDEKLRLYYDGYIALNSVVYGTTTSGTVRTLYIGNANYLLGGISSVRKSKTNIENVSNVNWIYNLNPVTFNYRKADENKNYTDEFYNELNYGLIAEDTQPIADFLINYNDKEDGTKEMIGIEYPRLIVPLLKAIQELNTKLDTANAKIAELEAK